MVAIPLGFMFLFIGPVSTSVGAGWPFPEMEDTPGLLDSILATSIGVTCLANTIVLCLLSEPAECVYDWVSGGRRRARSE